jgi:hypothetical protein
MRAATTTTTTNNNDYDDINKYNRIPMVSADLLRLCRAFAGGRRRRGLCVSETDKRREIVAVLPGPADDDDGGG